MSFASIPREGSESSADSWKLIADNARRSFSSTRVPSVRSMTARANLSGSVSVRLITQSPFILK